MESRNPISVSNNQGQGLSVSELKRMIPEFSRRVWENSMDSGVWGDLGVALRCDGKLETAICLYRRALALNPDCAGAMSNLGGALRATGKLDESIKCLQDVVERSPGFLPALFNLGLAMEDAGRLQDALNCYEKVLSVDTNRRDAAEQKAFTLLRLGDLNLGFEAYEKRFLFEPRLRRGFKQPRWDGSEQKGKTLLLYGEQGRGDTIQFVRYAARAKKLVERVVVECPPELCKLVGNAEGVDEVVPHGSRLPKFDLQASLMSMPFLFKTDLDSIPNEVPYLRVPKQESLDVQLMRSDSIKVGIAWASGHSDVGVHERSMNLSSFLPLFENPQVMFYSLQVGPAAAELQSTGVNAFVQDLGKQFGDFFDTACAIDQLDLVISVDTAIVHLAGALAKPVWILLPYAAEWRWMRNRTDTPWYPTGKLYRQEKPFGWETVIDGVKHDLFKLTGQ